MIVYALGLIMLLLFMTILVIAALLIIAMEGMVFEPPKDEGTTTHLRAVTRTIRAVTDRIRAVERTE